MFNCVRCNGSGYESYEEDGRSVRDACYHCSTTGKVDQDVDFHDRLKSVAHTIAYQSVSDYKKERDCGDNYEEDFAFCAAENMMTEYDYFTVLVWDEEFENLEKLSKMSLSDQELLIAWNETEVELPPFDKTNVIVLRPYKQEIIDAIENNDIPF